MAATLGEGGIGVETLSPLMPETADIETSSEDYARRFSGAVGAWMLRVQEESTLRLLAPYRGASVLDVGGGHGQLTGPLIREGFTVTVLGSAASCAERIRAYVDAGQCAFDVGNVVELPYADRSFDVVISYRLLSHARQWQRLLAEMARVARRAVLVDYPSVTSLNALTPYLFTLKKRVEGNTRTYTSFREEDLVAVMRPLGYERAGREPEFFLPMVVHRFLKRPAISAALEKGFRGLGLTAAFGSPVIVRFVNTGAVS